MKLLLVSSTVAALLGSSPSSAFTAPSFSRRTQSRTTNLSMVLEKPKEKKLSKLEILKVDSDHLVHPLQEVSARSAFGIGTAHRRH